MKQYKIFSLIVGLGILVSGLHFVFAENSFSDIPENNKNKEAIYFLRDKGIIQGYENNTFRPLATVNRAELVKILVAGKGISPHLATYSNCFPDVKEEWFAPFVCYAKEKQWVSGYPDGNFRPAQTVNKVEALKMLINSQSLNLPPVSETLFDDVGNGEWFAPYVKIAKDKNLLEETANTFAPSQEMSRGSISENLFRLLYIQEKKQERYESKNTNKNESLKPENKNMNISTSSDQNVNKNSNENKNFNIQQNINKNTNTALPQNQNVNYNTQPQNRNENSGNTQTSTSTYQCSSNRYNCSDFSTQREAQNALEYCMQKVGKDIHDLDRDSDGIACETLK